MRADYIEPSDSSAAQTRALAAALRGKHFDVYSLGLFGRSAARLFPWVPKRALGAAARLAVGNIGTPQSRAGDVRTEDMARWTVDHYPERKYKTILLGAPSGGVSHIGAILDAPFLTTHFLVCFQDVRHVDDVYSTFSRARRLAVLMAGRNKDLHLVAHYDPVHDRPVLLFINHVRAKLLRLPETYKTFIRERLAPGGTLAVVDCSYPWLQYRVRRRVSFQVGGLGGVPDTEFLEGSDRIDEYLESQDSFMRGGWALKNSRYELEKMPESEWGTMPEFVEDTREFARREGIPLAVLSADHPEKFGELAFELHTEASRRDGIEPLYVFADCFNQLDPLANLESRLLPLWLPYYCGNSFEYARRMLERAPADAQALLTMHPSFAEPFDMVPLEKWIELFTRDLPPVLMGIDREKFPNDMGYVYEFGARVRAFCRRHRDPVIARLDAAALAETAGKIGMEVSWV